MNNKNGFLQLQDGIIYGPVRSRRLGSSLGVNLLPSSYKLCGFNCVYCQYGPTPPSGFKFQGHDCTGLPAVEEVRQALRNALVKHPDVSYVTFSGNGEATLHPDFDRIVDIAVESRDSLAPHAKVAILSNANGVIRADIHESLMKLDVPIMKLDAGNEDLFKRINRPHPSIKFNEVIEGLVELDHPNLTIQTLFIRGKVDNTSAESIKVWSDALAAISPKAVQIYSLDRPAAESGFLKVDKAELDRIAMQVNEATGIQITAYS